MLQTLQGKKSLLLLSLAYRTPAQLYGSRQTGANQVSSTSNRRVIRLLKGPTCACLAFCGSKQAPTGSSTEGDSDVVQLGARMSSTQ